MDHFEITKSDMVIDIHRFASKLMKSKASALTDVNKINWRFFYRDNRVYLYRDFDLCGFVELGFQLTKLDCIVRAIIRLVTRLEIQSLYQHFNLHCMDLKPYNL